MDVAKQLNATLHTCAAALNQSRWGQKHPSAAVPCPAHIGKAASDNHVWVLPLPTLHAEFRVDTTSCLLSQSSSTRSPPSSRAGLVDAWPRPKLGRPAALTSPRRALDPELRPRDRARASRRRPPMSEGNSTQSGVTHAIGRIFAVRSVPADSLYRGPAGFGVGRGSRGSRRACTICGRRRCRGGEEGGEEAYRRPLATSATVLA